MLDSILEHRKALLNEGRGSHSDVAECYARLGKFQEAIDQLQASIENREMNILTLGPGSRARLPARRPALQGTANQAEADPADLINRSGA